jgi:hypothetical protein
MMGLCVVAKITPKSLNRGFAYFTFFLDKKSNKKIKAAEK